MQQRFVFGTLDDGTVIAVEIGSTLDLYGIDHDMLVTHISGDIASMRRVHPVTGELEGGVPFRSPVQHLRIMGHRAPSGPNIPAVPNCRYLEEVA